MPTISYRRLPPQYRRTPLPPQYNTSTLNIYSTRTRADITAAAHTAEKAHRTYLAAIGDPNTNTDRAHQAYMRALNRLQEAVRYLNPETTSPTDPVLNPKPWPTLPETS